MAKDPMNKFKDTMEVVENSIEKVKDWIEIVKDSTEKVKNSIEIIENSKAVECYENEELQKLVRTILKIYLPNFY